MSARSYEGEDELSSLVALMIAPLVVWIGVFLYLMNLDAKVRKLNR